MSVSNFDAEAYKKNYDRIFKEHIYGEEVPNDYEDLLESVDPRDREPANLDEEFEKLVKEMREYVHAKIGASQLTEDEGNALLNMIEDRLQNTDPNNSDNWDGSAGCW